MTTKRETILQAIQAKLAALPGVTGVGVSVGTGDIVARGGALALVSGAGITVSTGTIAARTASALLAPLARYTGIAPPRVYVRAA